MDGANCLTNFLLLSNDFGAISAIKDLINVSGCVINTPFDICTMVFNEINKLTLKDIIKINDNANLKLTSNVQASLVFSPKKMRELLFSELKAQLIGLLKNSILNIDYNTKLFEKIQQQQQQTEEPKQQKIVIKFKNNKQDPTKSVITINLMEEINEDITLNITKETIEKITKSISEDVTEDIKEDVTEDIKLDIIQEINEDIALNITKETIEKITEDIKEDIDEDIKEDTKINIMQEIKGDIALNLTKETIEKITKDIKEDIKEDVKINIIEKITDVTTTAQEQKEKKIILKFKNDDKKEVNTDDLDTKKNKKQSKLVDNHKVNARDDINNNYDYLIKGIEYKPSFTFSSVETTTGAEPTEDIKEIIDYIEEQDKIDNEELDYFKGFVPEGTIIKAFCSFDRQILDDLENYVEKKGEVYKKISLIEFYLEQRKPDGDNSRIFKLMRGEEGSGYRLENDPDYATVIVEERGIPNEELEGSYDSNYNLKEHNDSDNSDSDEDDDSKNFYKKSYSDVESINDSYDPDEDSDDSNRAYKIQKYFRNKSNRLREEIYGKQQ